MTISVAGSAYHPQQIAWEKKCVMNSLVMRFFPPAISCTPVKENKMAGRWDVAYT